MKKAYIICILSLWIAFAFGQSEKDSIKIENLVSSIKDQVKQKESDSIGVLYSELNLYCKTNDYYKAWIRKNIVLGRWFAQDKNLPFNAIELLEKCLQSLWRMPNTHTEWEQYVSLHFSIGHIYKTNLGDYRSAKQYFESGYGYFQTKLNANNDPFAAYIYHQLGNTYTRLGDYENAKNMLERGIGYAKKHNQPNTAKYNDLAIVLIELERPEIALKIVEEGILAESNSAVNQVHLRLAQFNALLKLNKLDEARAAIEKIPALFRLVEKEGRPDKVELLTPSYYSGRAIIFQKKGQYAAAEKEFQKAVETEIAYRKTEKRREVAKILDSYGTMLLEANKPEQALSQFQRMLTCLLPKFQPQNNESNPAPALFFAENTLMEALEGKARALVRLNRLEKALECYELIPYVEAELRETYAYESSSLISLNEARQRFEDGVELAWQLYERTQNQQFAHRAFRLTEQARSLLVLQSLAYARTDFRLPEETRRRESDFRNRIAWLEQQIAEARESQSTPDTEQLRQLENELFKYKQAQQAFIEDLRRSSPTYAGLSDSIRLLTVAEAGMLLRPGQVMADFFLTDTNAYVFFFGENGHFSWRKAVLPPDFRQKAKALAEYLTHADEENAGRATFAQTAAELYALLLGPELAAIARSPQTARRLLLVPDDVLSFVPFELLLQVPVSGETAWRQMPFLLKNFAVGYAYSGTLLRVQQEISATRKGNRRFFAGFAPNYKNQQDTTLQKLIAERERGGMYNLVGTHTELRNIRAEIGGDIFDGDPATEARFKAVAEQYRILHLAMHAIADEENPTLSRLLFGDRIERSAGQSTDELLDDNVLYANELQLLHLQADLAVLSACHTGFGRWHKGEGVFSLARAFAAAGVPATVMSLWRLPDRSAPALMAIFYKHLGAGLPKDEALQRAKIAFLETDSLYYFAHPYFWAGVTVNGDPSALTREGPSWGLLLGLGTLLVVLAVWYRRRAKSMD